MNSKQDPAFGVKCFSIAGRMLYERERCMGMTDEERRWRNQWLNDQILKKGEPKFVPEYYKDTTNIFRRCWIGPMRKLEQMLEPRFGEKANFIRHYIGKTSFMIATLYLCYYYLKFTSNDWTCRRRFEIHSAPPRLLPGDPGFPNAEKRSAQFYADNGFSKSVFHGK